MLEILYRDERLVVINKPAGMLVHRTAIDRGETVFAVQELRDQIGSPVHPVHRLDKPTSGALVFALSIPDLKLLQAQFTERNVKKTYWAIVRGYLNGAGTVDYPLTRELDRYAPGETQTRQNALTHFQCLSQTELPIPVGRYPSARYSLVELQPITGRRHQLRRHMAHIRHPIVGDSRHGDGKHNRFFREPLAIRRLLLHARTLSFDHPTDGNRITLTASLDNAFAEALEKTNLRPSPPANTSLIGAKKEDRIRTS